MSALEHFSSSLLDPENYSDEISTTSTCSLSDSDESTHSSARRPVESLNPARVPSFDEVVPIYDPTTTTPNIFQALHRLAYDVTVHEIQVVDYYADLRSVSPLLSPVVAPRAHVDGGSIATTTDRLEYLFSYQKYTTDELLSVVRLKVADDTVHTPTGVGYLKVPCHGHSSFMFVKCFYTPQIPATILSPDSVAKSLRCQGYSTFSDLRDGRATMHLIDCSDCNASFNFSLQSIRGLLFTDSLVAPTNDERRSPSLPDAVTIPATTFVAPSAFASSVRALSVSQQQALWHCRLGHAHSRSVADLHKYVDGIPKLSRTDPLTSCPLCKRAKLHKSNRGPPEEATPSVCWQDIQIDMGFMVQLSNPKTKKNTKAESSSDAVPKNRKERNLVADLRALPALPRRSSRSNKFSGSYREHSSSRRSPPDSPQPLPSPSPVVDPSPPLFRPPPSPTLYSFERILDHQGPLRRNDKRYRGDSFNLKILWTNKQTTWEPLSTFFEDQPHEVIDYARRRDLLDNPHWTVVREAAMAPDFEAPLETAFHEEFDHVPDTAVPLASSLEDKPKRYKRALGLYGETCYVIITDRHSGSIKVSVRRDKTPPVDFLSSFIANYKPNVPHCRVRFDGGGELGGNSAIHDLFSSAGYDVEVTSPDTSSAIGLAERPHRTIAGAVRTMLYSAGLDIKYWPFALQYHVLIHNCLPHGDRPDSAFTMCTGRRFNVSRLRVFGCRVYALPTEKRDVKLDVHARPGIFLGYRKSLGNALYIDSATGKVKQARHLSFDEGMQDSDSPPPYVKFLQNPDLELDPIDLDREAPIDVSLSPFSRVTDVNCVFRPQDEHALGIIFGVCPKFRRAYASDFTRPLGPYTIEKSRRNFLGGYITKIDDSPVFSIDDIARVLQSLSQLELPPTTICVRISSDLRSDLADTRPPALTLRPVDIRRIAAMTLVAGEGTASSQRAQLRETAATPLLSATPPDPDDLQVRSAPDLLEMRKLSNDHMTEEEKALPSFTLKRLMRLSNWPEWQAADDKQLDQHFDAGTIGKAVPRPPKDPMKPSQVFRLHWARMVKANGVRKSRACLDGSKRAAPWLRMMVQTYSSCVELPCLRAFIAICVNRGYYICFGDVENAYQQSPPPSIDCYLDVDDTIYDWYLRRFGVKLDRFKDVIPLFRALQGHPEAGVLWERMITDILINKMGFKNTAHEKNLYTGLIDGEEVLVCRQVDDFAAGAASRRTAERFMETVRSHVESEYAGMGIELPQGMYQRYNGIDIFQARDHVKLSAESYIDRMLQTHGWDAPKHPDKVVDDDTKVVPLLPSIASKLMTLKGPPEKSPEAKALSLKCGFSYRNILGELIYAYVICRLDIGYAVCFLARFADAPHEEHYRALKQVCKYLRATKSWGIMYQRPAPLEDLPHVPFSWLSDDPELPAFPVVLRDELAGFLDAAHATDLNTRRSVTGFVILFCCAAIAWKSRLQSLVATSSTEAEFYAGITCAKAAKYLRYILQQLEAIRPGATPLYIDNQAAIAMINESRPTPRARHIEVQHFAIQEWRKKGDVVMRHCPGVLNPSDDLTKPLGWVLHARHARRSMGHYKLASPDDSKSLARSPMLEQGLLESGRVLEPNLRPTQVGRDPSSSIPTVDDVDGHSIQKGSMESCEGANFPQPSQS